jgi:hypothetical protein
VESAYDYVYKPLFLKLLMEGDSFPLTIVYSKLKWCAYAYDLAKRILKESMYIDSPCPEHNRVVQYHSPQSENASTLLHIMFVVKEICFYCDAHLKLNKQTIINYSKIQ